MKKEDDSKSKIISFSITKGQVKWCVSLNGVNLEIVLCFSYQERTLAAKGTSEAEANHRVGDGVKVLGVLRNVLKGRSLTRKAKMGMFEGKLVSIVLYGCKEEVDAVRCNVLKPQPPSTTWPHRPFCSFP